MSALAWLQAALLSGLRAGGQHAGYAQSTAQGICGGTPLFESDGEGSVFHLPPHA